MDKNDPVWTYYEKGYIHPDFVPYDPEPINVKGEFPSASTVDKVHVLTWPKMGRYDGLVNRDDVRVGWGLDFVKLHEDDPCPAGWKAMPKDRWVPGQGHLTENWCTRQELEFEPVFYSDKAFVARRQYWPGYTQPDKSSNHLRPAFDTSHRRISDEFDMRSISPFTGDYQVFFLSKYSKQKYGKYPGPDSLLPF